MTKHKKIILNLIKNDHSLCAVESCTGGYLSYLITQVPGSSKIFKGSIIAYSLQAKNKFLGLNKRLLKKTQGISSTVATQLARKARTLFNTDTALSIVGVAGPDSVNKIPAGTVYIAVISRNKAKVSKFSFSGTRDQVRKQAAKKALYLLA